MDKSTTTTLVGELAPEQAYKVGAAVASLLKDGMPTERAIDVTARIAEFVKRGLAAQQAVDAIIAAEQAKLNS